MTNRFVRVAGLTLGVLLFVGSQVRADDTYTITYSPQGGQGVTVNYTNPANPSGPLITGQGTDATPFGVHDVGTTTTNYAGFCLDLWHGQNNNVSYTSGATLVTALNSSTVYPFSTYAATDLDSRLNYVGALFNGINAAIPGTAISYDGTTLTGGDAYVSAAIQLVLWSLIDKNFSFTGDSHVVADYNALKALATASGSTGVATNISLDTVAHPGGVGLSTTSYGTSTDYSTAGGKVTLLNLTPGQPPEGDGQNIINWGGGLTITSIPTPEPSTLAIAGLGALGFLGYGWKRRKSF